ncbi:hypothetical protein POM88_016396 [Heracleum sosnowskyi]|uniref:Peptidase S8/S53 domain-containing protein n=1 Tax=Heracleum sosnowskyi TaxID=360622 RepID=A0AAD8MYE5_9APIA|nr:hypothetical protein POM88_016396 [Heracleum sosnowskyi]
MAELRKLYSALWPCIHPSSSLKDVHKYGPCHKHKTGSAPSPSQILTHHAASRGVVVVSFAGNEGQQRSATNLAPWLITVAASSTDRDFTSDIMLGNGAKIAGESCSLMGMKTSTRIIIFASEAFEGYFTPYQSRHVESSTESKLQKSVVVKEAGGVGMILIDEADKDVAIPLVSSHFGVFNNHSAFILNKSQINLTYLQALRLLGDGFGAAYGMTRNVIVWVLSRMHLQEDHHPIWEVPRD